jgi:hypothetical protein
MCRETGRNSIDCQLEKRLRPLASKSASPSRHQVDDKNDERYNQQKMNQAARDVKTETKQPQNQNYYKNRPEHFSPPLFSMRVTWA